MLIQGKPVESMMDPKLMELLRQHGVVYLHKSAGPEGDGWIVSGCSWPQDPFSPETIAISLRKKPEQKRTEDSGVFDKTTGLWMVRVAANPQAGQYVFDRERGYTFAAADEGHARYFMGDPLPLEPLTAEELTVLRQLAGVEPITGSFQRCQLCGSTMCRRSANPDDCAAALECYRAAHTQIRNLLPQALSEIEEARSREKIWPP